LKRELGDKWAELMFFDSINHYWDKLGSGVCDILASYPSITKTLSSRCQERIKTMVQLSCTNHVDKVANLLGITSTSSKQISREILERFFDPFENPYEFRID